MQRTVVVMVAVMALVAASAWAGCGSCAGDKPAGGKAAACCKAGDTAYACVKCNLAKSAAGKCSKCNGDMAPMHVLAVKEGKVSVCPCEAKCKCTVKADDPAQCSCGKPVTTLDCDKSCAAPEKAEEAKPAKPDADAAKPKDHPAH